MKGIFLALILTLVSSAVLKAQDYVEYHRQGMAALEARNYPSYLENARKADSLRPNHPSLMYSLAKSYALNNQDKEAAKTLEVLTHFYASVNVLDTTDFNSLFHSEDWYALEEMVKTYQTTKETSDLAFEIEKAGFHTEGIAYHAKQDVFYITDIREGHIYRVNQSGTEIELLASLKELGYWSAMGVAIDPTDDEILWVTTSAVSLFSGYNDAFEGKSAVLKLHTQTGELLKAYKPNSDGHLFGDLIITSQGKLYTTDSNNPLIFTIDENGDSLTQAFKNEDWWNLQGLAFSDDEQALYVSDYIQGIYKIEMATGVITTFINENERLRGGDGIYQKDSELYILQNGSTPKRIARIKIDKEGYGIPGSLSFPDQARDDLEEPTLGTWVNSELFYIANSPWGYYDDENQPKTNEWPALKIFRLNTKK